MKFAFALAILALFLCSSRAQQPGQSRVIINGSVGNIHPGMTIGEAIQALNAEYYSHALSGDYGWFTQIHDAYSGDHEVMMSLWSDQDQGYLINYSAAISTISLHSPEFKTPEGVHVGMKLKEVERRLGKLLRISTAEPAYEQYAAFSKQPRYISFKVTGGIFKQGERETQKFEKDAAIQSIELTKY